MEYKDLKDVSVNIELGTRYFTKLLKYYDGNYYLAIAAYNAGIRTVAKWIEKGIIKEDRLRHRKYPIQRNKQLCKKNIEEL